MESKDEGKRLAIKTDIAEIHNHLNLVDFPSLKNDSIIVDAGSGVGLVSKEMPKLLGSKKATIYLLDGSETRLKEARKILKNKDKVSYKFITCNLSSIPLPDNYCDFIFCRFLFEYLSDELQQKVFQELKRILKPGGKLVIGDLDLNCLCHYPIDKKLEKRLFEITEILYENKLFDGFVGRKLYTYFYGGGMQDIKIHVTAHNLFYGDMEKKDLYNWEQKLNAIIQLQKKNIVTFNFSLEKIKKDILDFLEKPGRFSYTPYIMSEGIK